METCLKLLDLGYYELKIALEGLADDNVWKRPAPGLLSIGELVGHHAYWEAIRLAGNGPDPADCPVTSPLIDRRFRYYPVTLETPPSAEHLSMTAEQLTEELLRVHAETLAHFKAANSSLESRIPGCPANFTYGEYLEYAVFHIAYHTGQIYSARHLLGEEPPDN